MKIKGASRVTQNISSQYDIPFLKEISNTGAPAAVLVCTGLGIALLFFSNQFGRKIRLVASIGALTTLAILISQYI